MSARQIVQRAGVAAVGVLTAVTVGLVVSASPAAAAPRTPQFGSFIDPHASLDAQDTCDPVAKPGVIGFKDLLNASYGSHTSSIIRSCSAAGVSEHKEGRALDYSLDVNNSAEHAIADNIIGWLLATDNHGNQHAMARRLGIMYMIWNRQIWSAHLASEGWRVYDGPNPHTDHIHFSFSWAGALERSTWWTAGAVGEYDADGYTDLALYRRDCSNGSSWWARSSRTTDALYGGTKFGGCTDIPAPGDYDRDGYTDLALYRRDCTNGSSWWVRSSRTGETINGGTKFGGCGDIPAPGDYDGDGYTDLALYRQDCTNGSTWWVRSTRTGATINGGTAFGGCTDIPSAGDYDGDAYTDLALYRRDCTNGSSWWVQSSRTGATVFGGTSFGGCTDIPSAGDYDADGYTDLALYRRDCTNGSSWRVRSSRTGSTIYGGTKFGGCTDIPATST